MKISITSVFPELYTPFLSTSLVKRARESGLIDVHLNSFFSYVQPKERIDAPTFGPGAGMLIKPEVVERAVCDAEKQHGKAYKIFFSPQGKKLDQQMFKDLAVLLQEKKHIMLLPARYEGMDTRVEQEYADEIISIGDFVLMGGDVPAMVLLEGLLRYIPGVVGKEHSVEQDSFSGAFVDYPSYTEPIEWCGKQVPDIVRSGNHQAIDDWRTDKAVTSSVLQHFTWVQNHVRTEKEKELVAAHLPGHYVMLCHSNVLIGEEKLPGTTSVTSLDIHDIARSCKTYGIRSYWLVTPLADQQKVVRKFLSFWNSDIGSAYNAQRKTAIAHVDLAETVEQVLAEIEAQEGKRPLLVATSARLVDHAKAITFFDQSKVWAHDRPVLLVFGTGQGLTDEFVQKCDYLLTPVEGFSAFNHLSVRSAAAIVLDRWLGIHNKKVQF
jgi:tRNA (guanine37-N1)-methyltransferase